MSNESPERPDLETDPEKIAADGLDESKVPGQHQPRFEPDLETDAEKIAADGLD